MAKSPASKSAPAASADSKNSAGGTFAPGQVLTCVVQRDPRSHGEETTLERLMRRDPEHKRALRRAQRMRAQRMNVYVRGNRDWTSREKPARVVRAVKGATWTMEFTPDIAKDLASVADCLTIK